MGRNKRLVPGKDLEPFFSGVDDFAVRYLVQHGVPPKATSPKVIADPVGAFCSLDSWEVSIIDTPLFQRLRGIRQLGLAYLVYPTLGYSRFEHVLGVRAQLDQVVTTLRQNQLLREHSQLPTDGQLIRMRLAVLCHDIGHCIFSHVSEAVIDKLPGNASYPSASAILNAFEGFAGRPIPMAEILSVAILTSPPFVAFLNTIRIPTSDPLEGIASDAAHLILGVPIPKDPNSLFLAQLMNSGLDVDKLDYMLRESLLSGISLSISLQWLMKKLFITSLPLSQLPQGLASRIRGFKPDDYFSVLSLERGGQFAFEEFCVARLALHEKIYLHHKKRASEIQTKTILKQMADTVSTYNEVHQWLYLRESIMHHPEMELPAGPEESRQHTLYKTYASQFPWDKIMNREILARAYAFGWQNSIAGPLNELKSASIDRFMEAVRCKPEQFTAEICKNLTEMANVLGEDVNPDTVDLCVDPPRLSTLQQGQDTIHIEYPPRLSLRWTMPIDQIEEYYYRNRALGYVYTTEDQIPYVLLAAEKAAWTLFQVVCVQEGFVNKRYTDRCREMRVELNGHGFYADAPYLRPMNDFLEGAEAQRTVTGIAEILSAYESRSKQRVSPASVTTYVAQFPDGLQKAALKWLACIDLIRPEKDLIKQIDDLLPQSLAHHEKIGISPLGATTDSATHISYYLREPLQEVLARHKKTAPQVPLTEALGMRLDAYVIYDDNTNSGLQALNIVAGWLQKTLPPDLQLKEEHVQPLAPDLRDELLAKPLLFVFAVATEGAPSRLVEYLVAHCGLDRKNVKCFANRILPARERIFSGPDSHFQDDNRTELRKFVTDVARSIFLDEGKPMEQAESRALGDHASEAMIVFPYNCPTMTIPALWLSGTYKNSPWIPLIERGRRKNPITGSLSGEDA